MAELWFYVLTRALLRRGEFTTRTDVADRIVKFATRYNRTARSFAWAYAAAADHTRYRRRHVPEPATAQRLAPAA
jgi:hypothetical protein